MESVKDIEIYFTLKDIIDFNIYWHFEHIRKCLANVVRN